MSTARRAIWKGARYLVAPATLLLPGILTRSRGRELLSPEELRRSVPLWDCVPLVVNHPVDADGVNLWARDTGGLRDHRIGFVQQSRWLGAVVVEAWFHCGETGRQSPFILERLERGEPIGISVGFSHRNRRPLPADLVYNSGCDWVCYDLAPDHIGVVDGREPTIPVGVGVGVLVPRQ